jgi:hypothetical protein
VGLKTKRTGEHKTRLCLNGSAQVQGVDFDQAFLAALRQSSICVLMAIRAHKGLNLNARRHDLVAAFLQGTLLKDELVFMRQPPGRNEKGLDHVPRVYIVHKPIYGLKQAGRRFQKDFFAWLTAH